MSDVYDEESFDMNEATGYIEKRVAALSVHFHESELLDVEYHVDEAEIIQHNIESVREDDLHFRNSSNRSAQVSKSITDIDDLFERT